jgi:hypothetical protein
MTTTDMSYVSVFALFSLFTVFESTELLIFFDFSFLNQYRQDMAGQHRKLDVKSLFFDKKHQWIDAFFEKNGI